MAKRNLKRESPLWFSETSAAGPDRSAIAERLRTFIDYWHFETFHGSPFALQPDLWTLLLAAKDDLKARIVSQI